MLRRALRTVLLGTSILCAGSLAAQDQPDADTPPQTSDHDWTTYLHLGHLIEELPAWPTDRQFTEDEWDAYIKVAHAYQQFDTDDIEKGLLSYMIIARGERPQSAVLSKPMLLLRTMFEIPANEERGDPHHRIHACGALGADRHINTRLVALPIEWTSETPRLKALRALGPTIGSGPQYDPLIEFRYFHARFDFRDHSKRVKEIDWWQPRPAPDEVLTGEVSIDLDTPTPARPVVMGLGASPGSLKPGDHAVIVIRLATAPTWHVYPPRDDLPAMYAPLSPSLDLPEGLTAVENWHWPESHLDPIAQVHVLDGTFELRHLIRVDDGATPGAFEIECTVGYQACDPLMCLPPSDMTLSTTITIE